MLHAVCIESGCVGTGRSGVVAKVGGTESIRNLSFDVVLGSCPTLGVHQ